MHSLVVCDESFVRVGEPAFPAGRDRPRVLPPHVFPHLHEVHEAQDVAAWKALYAQFLIFGPESPERAFGPQFSWATCVV